MAALQIFLALFLLAFGLYIVPMILLRVPEFLVMKKVCRSSFRVLSFWGLHFGSAFVIAVFTPALCYVVGPQVMKALGHRDVGSYNFSFDMWAAFYLISIAVPLQLHYTVNARLSIRNQDGKIEPGWFAWYWSFNSIGAVTLAWLPLWCGWLDFSSFAFW